VPARTSALKVTTGGAVSLDQLWRPLGLVGGLDRIDRLEALDGYRTEVVAVLDDLLGNADAGAPDVDVLAAVRAVAYVNDVLTRRLLVLAEHRLGPPPCAYAWLALGSHGRGEPVPSSDQDNALAYEDGAAGADAYFVRLADLVVAALERAGLRRCDGGFMATRWCRPLGELQALFTGWVDRPAPDALLRAEVFLDVRPVHGRLDVDVLARTLVAGGSRGPFQVQMARAAVAFRPPLTIFGRLRTTDSRLDVKRAGTAAIVLLARLYALAAGSPATTTLLRLEAAADGGTLSGAGAAQLGQAYALLTGLRLRHQVAEVRAGRSPDDLLRIDGLGRGDRDRLLMALRAVRDVQEATALRFATHTVT